MNKQLYLDKPITQKDINNHYNVRKMINPIILRLNLLDDQDNYNKISHNPNQLIELDDEGFIGVRTLESNTPITDTSNLKSFDFRTINETMDKHNILDTNTRSIIIQRVCILLSLLDNDYDQMIQPMGFELEN